MKVSIITVCYNSVNSIKGTIESVLNQTYGDIEYIIIDGGSLDGTLEVINQYKDQISLIISEADAGIYDAMNKGIVNATGEIVGILNSDDIYFSNNVIENLVNTFKTLAVDAVYGNVILSKLDNLDNHVRKWVAGKRKTFIWGWHPPHPSLFIKRDCYRMLGLYKTEYQISADFELMLRFFEVHKITSAYLDEVIVNMRMGGASTGSIKNMLIGNINIRRAFKENGLPYFWIYPGIRIIKKILQFVN
ncbi:glycosyltransferase family 2 protein [Segetibacter aerophilus]|uniref:Glycosyl transferase n=1 Tax=Segetibacter aerophilus TaxID=670293 RepID=A0A512BD71_9BACT|nr:glycosyltransferase family 2 protein [Segetibacter aerophilus]GEO09909.1 glycosyl transferase [Segetibacter aerophilus]